MCVTTPQEMLPHAAPLKKAAKSCRDPSCPTLFQRVGVRGVVGEGETRQVVAMLLLVLLLLLVAILLVAAVAWGC